LRIRVALAVLACLLLLGVSTAYAARMYGEYNGFPIVKVVVDGQVIMGDVPAINFHGRTMVPVRFVAEALGADVGWDPATETAMICSQPASGGTGFIEPATNYADWHLTYAEVDDAVWWGASGSHLTYKDLLPMYYFDFPNNVGITFKTPWAQVASQAAFQYDEYGEIIWDYSDFIDAFDGTITVMVFADIGADAECLISAQLIQGSYVLDPYHTEPLDVEWSSWGTYTAFAVFEFDATSISKDGNVTVRITIDGYPYEHTWWLGNLK